VPTVQWKESRSHGSRLPKRTSRFSLGRMMLLQLLGLRQPGYNALPAGRAKRGYRGEDWRNDAAALRSGPGRGKGHAEAVKTRVVELSVDIEMKPLSGAP
jgi:hypothetical protein